MKCLYSQLKVIKFFMHFIYEHLSKHIHTHTRHMMCDKDLVLFFV